MDKLLSISVYETPSYLYLVGSNVSQKYSLLKIDRIKSSSLLVIDSGCEYSKHQVDQLLEMAECENNSPKFSDNSFQNRETCGNMRNCYGILGLLRFLEGYYLIVVTKATEISTLGYHSVFKIEEVYMHYISKEIANMNADEQKYLRLFQSVDLTTDFYFSYTYDLGRTLQENASPSSFSSDRFIWNTFLCKPLIRCGISNKWMLSIIHGYIGRADIILPGTNVVLLLIARRAATFAGTRFLKRGANNKGDLARFNECSSHSTVEPGSVANDVQTEQIVWDRGGSPCFLRGKFSSFVQIRGSVPLLWCQDPGRRPSVVMAKPPPITFFFNQPYAQTAAAHFSELRQKYSSPIVVINLVKRREKQQHESILHDRFLQTVNYLNQFLPPNEAIIYLSFDVASCNRSSSVMPKLEEIGFKTVIKQGWFQSFPRLHCQTLSPSRLLTEYKPNIDQNGHFLLQKGISRTNCVDCLDRTNVAQFVIGKVALGCQLYSLGLLDEPFLSLDSQICGLFEDIFEQLGDTLALQYAGSQMVHGIKTYRKTAAFQERSRDVIQTLSRYYSNTFSDYEKQNALNLFLGIFQPCTSTVPLWELTTDEHLHNAKLENNMGDYCHWMDEQLVHFDKQILWDMSQSQSLYDAHYRTFELTSLNDLLNVHHDLGSRALSARTLNPTHLNSSYGNLLGKSVMDNMKGDAGLYYQHKNMEYSSSENEEQIIADIQLDYLDQGRIFKEIRDDTKKVTSGN